MTRGQQNKKSLLPSKHAPKKGLSLPTSTLRLWKPGKTTFSTADFFGCNASNGTAKLKRTVSKRTVSPVPSSSFKMSEVTTMQGAPIGISKSGVYFENQPVYEKRHPAQGMHNPFHITKLPKAPIGTPLSKPPRLAFAKPGLLPCVQSPPLRRNMPTNIIQSFLRPKKTARRVSIDKSMDDEGGTMDTSTSNASKLDLGKNNIASISNKILSKEERVFLEAATLLSAAKP